MKKSYNEEELKNLRNGIIGLGDKSAAKSYYPQLQLRLDELQLQNSRLSSLIEAIPDTMVIMTADGEIVEYISEKSHMTASFSQITINPAELETFIRTELREKLRDSMINCCGNNACPSFEFTFNSGGVIHYFEVRPSVYSNHEMLFMIRNMTAKRSMENQLLFLATRDAMTGLYNRPYFEQAIKNIENDKDNYKNAALIICDLDGLKQINDTYGHAKGDEMLRETSIIINSCINERTLAARIGGDEFALLITDSSHSEVEEICACLCDKIEIYNIAHARSTLSLSYGFAISQGMDFSLQDLFAEADNNMYKKKFLTASSVRSSIVKILMKALEARDFITEGHALRMEDLSAQVAEKLDLEESMINDIRLLAKFHDIGKVGIPDYILFKPDKLSSTEMSEMKRHSEIGYHIAAATPDLNPIAHLILKHHERWDGGGYPLGMKGKDIPIECRILSVVDSFDAMNNDRPYRKALTREMALAELQKCSGSQFDPTVVEVFIELLKEI